MTTLELKTRIQQNLEKVSDDVLQDVLDLLEKSQDQSSEQIRRDANFRRILSEDRKLLNRLAK
jgi:hypothetical protein